MILLAKHHAGAAVLAEQKSTLILLPSKATADQLLLRVGAQIHQIELPGIGRILHGGKDFLHRVSADLVVHTNGKGGVCQITGQAHGSTHHYI